MLRFVIKKMRHNTWLFLCLIFAAVIANSLICSIPIYSNSSSSKLLLKKFEAMIKDENKNPGYVNMNCLVGLHLDEKSPTDVYKEFEKELVERFKNNMGIKPLSERKQMDTKNVFVSRYVEDEQLDMVADKVTAVKNLEDHIKIIGGKGFSETPPTVTTGFNSVPQMQVIELMVERSTYCRMNAAIGDRLVIYNPFDKEFQENTFYVVEIVGVFEKVDDGSGFWDSKVYNEPGVFINFDVAIDRVFKEHPTWFNAVSWHLNYDYHLLDTVTAKKANAAYEDIMQQYKKQFTTQGSIHTNFNDIIEKCEEEVEKLTRDIMIFIIPVLFMLGLFVFMITQFIISGDHNEIAAMKSRGATKKDIFLIYLIESLIISVFAVIIGPFMGIILCKIIGSANGFLSFVGRKALDIQFNSRICLYAVLAQILFIINMLIPVLIYADVNVVEHSKRSGIQKRSWWKLLGVDFISLTISIYFLLKYYKKVKNLMDEKMTITEVGIDPILYLISTFFILGCALLFLRVYPVVIRGIAFVGNKYWSATLYAGFKNIGRIRGNELFIMLFMIMSIGIGILNANEARSYNQHNEESIRWKLGSDVVIEPEWIDFNEEPKLYSSGPESVKGEKRPDYWIEPDMDTFRKIKGVSQACKVAQKMPYASYIDKKIISGQTNLVAVEPYNMGKVTWYKNGLLPTHINNYLNIMSQNKQAIFVTSNVRELVDVEIGQRVELVMNDGKGFEIGRIVGVLCGLVDYWPGVDTKDETGEEIVNFIVDYRYVENTIGVIPYNIWIDLDDTGSEEEYLKALTEAGTKYEEIYFQDSEVINMRNNAYNMGLNGILTLGFVVIMVITMIGFMIYWLLALKQRSLQFGIMRAMGIGKRSIYKMLFFEQSLLFGSAILMGILIGTFTSQLVVPLLQLLSQVVTDTYPAVVRFNRSDYLKIYGMTMIMLMGSIFMIIRVMRKLKVADILKLGEER